MAPRLEFRKQRELHGFTQETLAYELGVAPSTVRSWEGGRRAPYTRIRPALARTLHATDAEVSRWFSNGAEIADGIMPPWLGHLAHLEQCASEIWTYEPIVVPGLAQTAAYARCVQEGEPGPPDRHQIRQAVRARIARQDVLKREPDPLRLCMILDESVLLRPVGGAKVMSAQLRHLIELAALPNVTVQVLPLDSGCYSAAFGYFSVLSSPRVGRPYMALTEDRNGGHYLDRKEDVDRHARLFQHLLTAALPEPDTLELIETTLRSRYP